jgi:hypothetical protein
MEYVQSQHDQRTFILWSLCSLRLVGRFREGCAISQQLNIHTPHSIERENFDGRIVQSMVSILRVIESLRPEIL